MNSPSQIRNPFCSIRSSDKVRNQSISILEKIARAGSKARENVLKVFIPKLHKIHKQKNSLILPRTLRRRKIIEQADLFSLEVVKPLWCNFKAKLHKLHVCNSVKEKEQTAQIQFHF